MFKTSTPTTKNPHESIWDFHGSYQWTYFSNEIKQRIKFFLSQRLNGKNIDVGGGWYLSYPNSVVVDLSSVCLKHNPATEKLQFDLDTIAEGEKLPYPDKSFDSATLISVWQYLHHPKTVLRELERILKPGAEMYLINGQGAGLGKCIVGTSRTDSLQKFFYELGYDTLIEHIPTSNNDVKEFQSVCVAMPDIDLFGATPPRIKNKAHRQKQDEETCQNPTLFVDAYVDWEMRDILSKLSKLSSFPRTKYSQEYLGRIEAFSQEYHKHLGEVPLIFVEHGLEPELAMLTPEDKHHYGTMFFIGVTKAVDINDSPADELLKKYELRIVRYGNYFNHSTTTCLLEYCANFKPRRTDYWNGSIGNEMELKKLAEFIISLPLNSFTKQLQQQIYARLKSNVSELDKIIQRQKGLVYHLATCEVKQARRIDELISIKKRIESENIPTIRTDKLEYRQFMPALKQFVRE
mgnify:CR=1 FL=1